MRFRSFIFVALAMLGLLQVTALQAQGTESAVRWKGNEYTTLLNGSGTEVFLYNVGTGRFLIHGGDWGTQSRLFYEDTGKTLTFQKGAQGTNNIFETGMSTGGSSALGANIPQVTSAQAWGNNEETFTVLMDGAERIGNGSASGTYRNWHFVRVPEYDANGSELTDVYTYYMYENFGTRSTNYNKENNGSGTARSADYSGVYIGAAYGENWNSQDGDPNGALVLQSSSFDKVTWSTVNPTSTTKWTCGVKNAVLEGLEEGTTSVQRSMADMVSVFTPDTKIKLQDFYKWRIVTKEQLLASMTNSDVNDGLSTNLTYLINDRGFERNDWSFFSGTDGWVANRFKDKTYSTDGYGRYKYTWGYLTGSASSKTNNQSGTREVSGSWMVPVRLKSQWDSKTDAKFGMLEFEGVGTVSSYIVAPEDGVYLISCYGFYQGSHEGYLFATTDNPNDISSSDITIKSTLKQETQNFAKGSEGTATASNRTGVKGAGYNFVYNKDSYYREVEITVTKGQRIYFGVGKNEGTRATGSGRYYYDSDWVCSDQYQISYLGTANAQLLDEDKDVTSFAHASYLGNHEFTNRTVRLHRKFATGKWNSFVFPFNLTAVQVRNAFGTDCRVAELAGIGVKDLSNNAGIIDFRTVSLPAEGNAITAGKFYIIMPTKEPTDGSAATGNKDYYTMGAFTFKTSDLDAVKIKEETYSPDPESVGANGHNSIKVSGTFFSSTNYDTSAGNNKNPDTTGPYVPAGAYVMGVKGDKYTMYHTTQDLKTKGFRAWIIDCDANGNTIAPTTNTLSVGVNGIVDGTTDIESIFGEPSTYKKIEGIYDLSGRKVETRNAELGTLPKGVYIVNGKKYVVK